MKFFKVSALVCLFFFMIACEDGATRFIPVDETDDGSSDVTDDSDATEPTNPTDEPTNPTDEPTNPTDDPTNPTDTGDTDPTDTGDTDPTDTGDTDTGDTGDTDTGDTGDTDTGDTVVDENEAECVAAGGTWDAFEEDELQKCYKIVDCGEKPANTEWRGEQTYNQYYDLEEGTWTNFSYEPEYGDTGEPKICQYICSANAAREGDECKPYCSAVFDGSSSKIEVAANELLNLASETWTIEAWIKQAADDITESNLPILRKGTTSATPAYLLTGYKYRTTYQGTPYYTIMGYVGYSYTTQAGPYSQQKSDTLESTPNYLSYSYGWSHVALVSTKETNGWQQTTYKLNLFINGEQKASESYDGAPTINTLDEALVIGANLNSELYFKGLIDSIKISNTAKYTEGFTPGVLAADDNTVAFWDFSNNANDSVSGIIGTPANIEYSTDCKE